ncbi:MAG: HNH endonuclease [Phycisphaerales bacterium]|nr:HNH endonuclease [Phycisphaerales bacterium]
MKKSRKRQGARAKLKAFFEANVGVVLTAKQLRDAAGADVSEWARRVRELRDEFGMQILTHNDREDLKPSEYLLETLALRPVISRAIGDKLRRLILERNGYTCQVCGAGAGEESGCEPGKRCRLQIDHVIPISQGGTDEEHNLRAVCKGYNKDKANLIVPTSRDAISAMALIRRQPRNVQLEVYKFLTKKFGPKPGGK